MAQAPLLLHDGGHLPSTYSALSILNILGDDFSRLQKDALLSSIRTLQQPDGRLVAQIFSKKMLIRSFVGGASHGCLTSCMLYFQFYICAHGSGNRFAIRLLCWSYDPLSLYILHNVLTHFYVFVLAYFSC